MRPGETGTRSPSFPAQSSHLDNTNTMAWALLLSLFFLSSVWGSMTRGRGERESAGRGVGDLGVGVRDGPAVGEEAFPQASQTKQFSGTLGQPVRRVGAAGVQKWGRRCAEEEPAGMQNWSRLLGEAR